MIDKTEDSSSGSNLIQALCDVYDKLTSEDLTVAWLALVHLKAFKCLPAALYDPSGNHPDFIVNKVHNLVLGFLGPISDNCRYIFSFMDTARNFATRDIKENMKYECYDM